MLSGGKRATGVIKQPTVTIITVVYNGAKLFEPYIENVARFCNESVEFVIIDGASTDGTLDLLQKHNNKIDYWLSEPDDGIYAAMNKAVKFAEGRWLFFLGIDDILLDGFTGMVGKLKDSSTVYYGNTIYYGKVFNKIYSDYFLTKLNLVHQSVFYPRKVFKKYDYDLKYKVYADYYLNLRLWKDKTFKFEYRNLLIASFPEGGFSSTVKDELFEKDRDRLFKKYLSRKAYYRYLNRTVGWFKTVICFITND